MKRKKKLAVINSDEKSFNDLKIISSEITTYERHV